MNNLINMGVVLHDHLVFREIREGEELSQVQVNGLIECANSVLISVDKWLDVRKDRRGQYHVKGFSYSYHAWQRDPPYIVRYDSAHGLEALHRHEYDASGNETIRIISLDELPALSDFILEALQLIAPTQGS